MPLAELRNGPEIRLLQAGYRREVDRLVAGLRNPPRGRETSAVSIEQQGDHHCRMKRG
jgi:hypothetical protein